jgi:hypothetical protein
MKNCSICLEDIPVASIARLVPCGHDAFCNDCIKTMLNHQTGGEKPCPICRTGIEGYSTETGGVNVGARSWVLDDDNHTEHRAPYAMPEMAVEVVRRQDTADLWGANWPVYGLDGRVLRGMRLVDGRVMMN